MQIPATLRRNIVWFLMPAVMGTGCAPGTQEGALPNEPLRVDQGLLEYLSTLPDGRVVSLHIIHRDPAQMAEPGSPQPMFIRYSNDNGLSWTEADTAFNYPGGMGVMSGGVSLVDREGNLHCFGVRYYHLATADSAGVSVLLHNRSGDGGKTWTEPHPVNHGHDYTGSFNNAIQLSSGRLLLSIEYSTPFFIEERGERNSEIVTVYSDDLGETWVVGTEGISVPAGEFGGHPGALEPVIVELKDGRVWMIIRTQRRRFYQAFSSDGGKTWSESSHTDFNAPNAPGGILRLSDGRLVFCWNDLSQYPDGKVEGSGRQYLHIAISGDDGKTWSPSKLIAQREEGENPNTNVAYPYLTETKDNHVLIAYHRVGNREGATWWYPIVEVLKIDPDWISMTKQ